MTNWGQVRMKCRAADLINISQGWRWSKYRQKWLKRVADEKMSEGKLGYAGRDEIGLNASKLLFQSQWRENNYLKSNKELAGWKSRMAHSLQRFLTKFWL
jgi:hypothetical protein